MDCCCLAYLELQIAASDVQRVVLSERLRRQTTRIRPHRSHQFRTVALDLVLVAHEIPHEATVVGLHGGVGEKGKSFKKKKRTQTQSYE